MFVPVCRLSVLQLAVDKAAYLLDVITLSELLADDDWRRLVENVFCNESLTVVGKLQLPLKKALLIQVHEVRKQEAQLPLRKQGVSNVFLCS